MDDDITRAKEEARKKAEWLKWRRERHEWKRCFAIAAGADALSAHYRAPHEEIPIIELAKMIVPEDQEKHDFLCNYIKIRLDETWLPLRDNRGNFIIQNHRAKRFIDEVAEELQIKIPPMVDWWLNECSKEPPKSWLIAPEERAYDNGKETLIDHDEDRNKSSIQDQIAKGKIKLPWYVQREKDDWVPAIKEAGQALLEELGKIPDSAQVWIRLLENPPHGYGIKRDGDFLTMPTARPLSRKEFETRWVNYTTLKDKDA
ncbi:MAG: hypothetical protein PHT19_11105 [Methylococcus sp.]|nr:hypothetical protein [Methylococcus sp.]